MGGLGVLFLAAGAILAFAVDVTVSGIDIRAVGLILMAVGAVAVIASLVQQRPFWRVRTERHVSADGRHVIDDTRTGA